MIHKNSEQFWKTRRCFHVAWYVNNMVETSSGGHDPKCEKNRFWDEK